MYGAAITLREEVFKNSQIRWHLDWGWYIGTMAEEATAAEIKKKKIIKLTLYFVRTKSTLKASGSRELPGSSMVGTLSFHCRGHRFNP